MEPTHCFMDSVINASNGKAYRVVMFDINDPLKFSINVLAPKDVISLVNSKKYVTDFKVKETVSEEGSSNFLLWDGRTEELSASRVEDLVSTEVTVQTIGSSIYNLLNDLVDNKGFFIPEMNVDETQSSLVGTDGITRFDALKVSKGTMNIYISFHTEEGWRTRNLVNIKDGQLVSSKFYFACYEELAHEVTSKYDMKSLFSDYVNGEKVEVFLFDENLGIYSYFHPQFVLCPAMLNYKTFESEKDKSIIDMLSYFITGAIKAYFPDTLEKPEDVADRPYTERTEDSYKNVLLNFKCKQPTREERAGMLSEVLNVYERYLKKEITKKEIIQRWQKMRYDYLKIMACLNVLQALTNGTESMLSRIEYAKDLRNQAKYRKLKVDLELFVYRAHIYRSNYAFPHNTYNFIMSGGNVPYSTEIVKKF